MTVVSCVTPVPDKVTRPTIVESAAERERFCAVRLLVLILILLGAAESIQPGFAEERRYAPWGMETV